MDLAFVINIDFFPHSIEAKNKTVKVMRNGRLETHNTGLQGNYTYIIHSFMIRSSLFGKAFKSRQKHNSKFTALLRVVSEESAWKCLCWMESFEAENGKNVWQGELEKGSAGWIRSGG